MFSIFNNQKCIFTRFLKKKKKTYPSVFVAFFPLHKLVALYCTQPTFPSFWWYDLTYMWCTPTKQGTFWVKWFFFGTDIQGRSQNQRHFYSGMGLKLGIFGYVTCIYCGRSVKINMHAWRSWVHLFRICFCFCFVLFCCLSPRVDNAITLGGIWGLGSLLYIYGFWYHCKEHTFSFNLIPKSSSYSYFLRYDLLYVRA